MNNNHVKQQNQYRTDLNCNKKKLPDVGSSLVLEYYCKLIIHIIKSETVIVVTVIVGEITFRIMNQLKTVISVFKEKVSNPEIQITIDIYLFVVVGQIIKSHSKRDIDKHIPNPAAVPEEVTIIAVILYVIMNEDLWVICKFTDYMPIIIVVIIIFVVSV